MQFQTEKRKELSLYWLGFSEVNLRLLEEDIQEVAIESMTHDILIQPALCYDGVLVLSIDQITADTRQWLTLEPIDRILAIALRTRSEEDLSVFCRLSMVGSVSI